MRLSDQVGHTAGIIVCCLLSVLWLCGPVRGAEQVLQNDSIAAAGDTGSIQAGLAASALPPSVFSCTRASDAYLIDRNGSTLFGPNVLRTEKVTSFTSHTGLRLGAVAEPLAIDQVNGDIIGSGVANSTLLTRSADGVSYTTIVNLTTDALIDNTGSGTNRLVSVAIAGTHMVFFVIDAPFGTVREGTDYGVRAYRMTRGGDGQWDRTTIVEIWHSLYGSPIHFSTAVRGNEVMWGEYIKLVGSPSGYDPARRGCGSWYIADIAADNPDTLVGKVAADPEVVPVTESPPGTFTVDVAGTGSHIHASFPDPIRLDTWYVATGDGIGGSFRKLVKPPGWSPGDLFSVSTIENRNVTEGLAILNDHIYLGTEGSSVKGTVPGMLTRYNLADYTQRDIVATIPHKRPTAATGIVTTLVFASGKTTITASGTPFISGHVKKDFFFNATNTPYLIADFISSSQIKVANDATGESDTDTFRIEEIGGHYKLAGGGEDLGEGAYEHGGAIILPVYTFAASTLNMNKGLYIGHGGDHFSTYLRIPQDIRNTPYRRRVERPICLGLRRGWQCCAGRVC